MVKNYEGVKSRKCCEGVTVGRRKAPALPVHVDSDNELEPTEGEKREAKECTSRAMAREENWPLVYDSRSPRLTLSWAGPQPPPASPHGGSKIRWKYVL